MEYFNIYTKGVDQGGLASAYIIYQDKQEVKRSAKRMERTVHYLGQDITLGEYTAHFVMEMMAIFSGISSLPDDCTAIIYTNDLTSRAKIQKRDDTEPYKTFVKAIWEIAETKNVKVILTHVRKDSCEETKAVNELALKTKRGL